MQPDNFISAKSKIVDFGFKTGSFTPDGQSEAINYTSLVIKVNIDGNIEELPLSGANALKPAMLRTVLRSIKDTEPVQDFLGNGNQ